MTHLTFSKISLPKGNIEGNKIVFNKEVSLQELASFLEADSAYDAGSCNSGYSFGCTRTFARTASGHILYGYVGREESFSVEAILLPDGKTLIKKFWGHNYHPEFFDILQDLGLEEKIVVDDDID